MDVKPITYQEWNEKRGESVELGARMLLTDKLQRSGLREAIDAAGKILSQNIIDGMVKAAAIRGNNYLGTVRDASLRATEITLRVDGFREPEALSYLYLAECGWTSEYNKRVSWENRPLISYIIHSITRTRLFRYIRDWWEGRSKKRYKMMS